MPAGRRPTTPTTFAVVAAINGALADGISDSGRSGAPNVWLTSITLRDVVASVAVKVAAGKQGDAHQTQIIRADAAAVKDPANRFICLP